jgi:hypothetical protein
MKVSDVPFDKLYVGTSVISALGTYGTITSVSHNPNYAPNDPDGDYVSIDWTNGGKSTHRHYMLDKVTLNMAIEFVNNSLFMNADRYNSLKKYDNMYLSHFDLVAIVFDKPTHGMDGVKVLKCRFWDTKTHKEVIDFSEFKMLCDQYILNDD